MIQSVIYISSYINRLKSINFLILSSVSILLSIHFIVVVVGPNLYVMNFIVGPNSYVINYLFTFIINIV
jgi:hypothetical protein